MMKTENRNCLTCETEYLWNPRNLFGLCIRCRKNFYKRRDRMYAREYKQPYPLTPSEKVARHRRIVSELNRTTTREERREIYRRELEWIEGNGILEWCTDLRQPTVIQSPGSGKVGRKRLSRNEYPSTKDMPYD